MHALRLRQTHRSTSPHSNRYPLPMPPASLPKKHSARFVAARAIGEAARDFPNIDIQSIDVDSIDHREGRLALAIHRTVLQRWLTIEYLLNGFLRKPMRTMEPELQGVLLTAGAQLLFMDRLPAHAVVDESVKLARGLVRAGATGLVNAVLRRVSELSDAVVRGKAWSPAANRLPLEDGFVPLRDDCLPSAGDYSDPKPGQQFHDLEKHLSIATSHPLPIVRRWLKDFGPLKTIELTAHSVYMPPIVVAVEPGFSADPRELLAGSEVDPAEPMPVLWEPHVEAGFIVWQGPHSLLTQFLRGNPARRVQDVTSSKAVATTATLTPSLILDYCAGRGTKTRQLAALHSNASIIATDTDDERRGVLKGAFAHENRVRVVEVREVEAAVKRAKPQGAGVDLLVLDVPCTNTGVLARRPEARYRFNEATLKSLIRLQRQIVEKSMPLVAPGGHILYSTCSIDSTENQSQSAWIREQFKCEMVHESIVLPDGSGTSYRDGGFVSLMKKTM